MQVEETNWGAGAHQMFALGMSSFDFADTVDIGLEERLETQLAGDKQQQWETLNARQASHVERTPT